MQIPNPRRITNSPIDSSSCQSQSQIQYSSYPLEFSIKPLTTTFEPHENPSLSRSCSSASIDTMISDLFSSTSSSSASFDSLLMSGDDIGMESCVDVLSDDDLSYSSFHHDCYSQRKERLCWAPEKEKKRTYEELPPPLSLLARTENLPSHMPWVLKRHYTTDGRLILTEEKVRHHEYFRAHRSNGRLRLQLVPLDGQVLVPPVVCCDDDDHDEEEVDDYDGYYCDNHDVLYDDNLDAYDGDDDAYDYDYDCHCDYDYDYDNDCDGFCRHGGVEQTIKVVNSSTASAGKCRNINTTVRTKSSCIVGVLAPAIRCVKGNTNGSRKGFLGQAGFGGLFRDHAGQVMISAFFDNIGISFTHRAKLAAFIFAMIIAWEKGWLHYGWIQILSWSYLFSLNPFLFFGLCVLSGDIDHEAFWELIVFGFHRNFEVKRVQAIAFLGWVTHWEVLV
ncbi:hypothetical protein DVH24_033335 [Malus domestica]|uniref:FAF domain-containing protein n=1 Tax=Malus domestica TaxID=3750 RepID=A0A498J9I0_MALDO|nr:hypothetical protein DVH24_033335 [Malus domestica]